LCIFAPVLEIIGKSHLETMQQNPITTPTVGTSEITRRFLLCHQKLRESKTIKSSRQFAIELDYLPQSLSEILKGRREATVDLLRKAVDYYRFNPIFLFTGEGAMFLSESDRTGLRTLTVLKDKSAEEQIIHVPIPAQSAYATDLSDPDFMLSLPHFSLPDYKYKVGTHRAFDVSGDGMEPTLFEGDKVVCSFVETPLWESALKDGYVYVIVTKGDVLIRRLRNQLKDNNLLEVYTDNSFYEPTQISINHIKEIWYVRAKISPFLPSPSSVHGRLETDMRELKQTIKEQSKLIENLNLTIEKLLNK
jgi:phage repressor protein C with HTH and peptisase S24 domain